MNNDIVYGDLKDVSPYMRFMIDNRGYYFENKKGERLDKWEIWNTFENNPNTLKEIYEGKHLLYKRKKVK